MTGLRATAGSTCASRASGGHGGRCHAGVPHARCVEDARERARRLERAEDVLIEMWIVWWRALAAERLVWDRWLRPWVRPRARGVGDGRERARREEREALGRYFPFAANDDGTEGDCGFHLRIADLGGTRRPLPRRRAARAKTPESELGAWNASRTCS